MEILRIKGAPVAVAKLLYFWTLLMLSTSCSAQIIQGIYNGDNGIIYHFKDSTFQTITRLHLENEMAEGSYKIEHDTLYLNFKPFHNPLSSNFQFIKRDPIYKQDGSSKDIYSSSLSVKFMVVDEKNNVLPQTNLLILKGNNQPIKGFVADSLGQFPELFIFGKIGSSFRFTFLGRKHLIIEADTLAGYDSKVKIILSPAVTYSNYSGTIKYLIKEIKNDRIILKNISDKKMILLKLDRSD